MSEVQGVKTVSRLIYMHLQVPKEAVTVRFRDPLGFDQLIN